MKPTYRVRVSKHLTDKFHNKNGLKQGDVLSPLLFIFALEFNSKFLVLNCNLCVISYFMQIFPKYEYNLLLGQNR